MGFGKCDDARDKPQDDNGTYRETQAVYQGLTLLMD